MNIQLQPKHLKFIQTQIESGRYQSSEEVISEAFRALEERDRKISRAKNMNYQKWVEETGQKVDVAREELKRGEVLDGENFVAQLQEQLKQARQKQA
ncbi:MULTISPECIES: type II toxin-antitoxin system ParD family antitoxin [Spirulina sp. CCY15215]|uniref:ribbon-helix-helix domain-containing protein n=1 Tax=Spirulina sp. CCY15215 TaxID=2767591 RepID=UPI00194F5282|nr:type II toxin-antitoxin system ParD family antitoxin [Spirulina major]